MHDDDDSDDDDDDAAAVQKNAVAAFPEMKKITRPALEPKAGKSGRGGSRILHTFTGTCSRTLT